MSLNDDNANPYRPPAPSPIYDNWYPPTLDLNCAIRTAGMYACEDCLRAIRLKDNSPPKTWLQWVTFAAGCASAGLATYLSLQMVGADWLLTVSMSLAAVVFLVIVVIMTPHLLAWIAWRRWAGQPIRRWISEEAIRTDMPNMSVTESWNLYRAHMRSDELVLLWAADFGAYCLYPRSHFANEEDWRMFVSLLDRKLERRFHFSAFGQMRRYGAVLSSHVGAIPRR